MKRKSLKSPMKYLASTVVALLISSYIIYHLIVSIGTGVETTPALYVTQEEKIAAQGYIFRDETIVYSTRSGITNYMFDSGEKVKNGTLIANIYSGTIDSDVEAQLVRLDHKIELLTQSTRTLSYSFADTSSLDAEIYDNYYLIQNKLASGDIDFAIRKLDDLLIGLNKRNSVIQSSIDFRSTISALTAQKNSLLSRYSGQSEAVYAKQSGYLYTNVDGYENIFTVSALDSLTIEGFKTLIESAPESIDQSRACGKIASNFKWYLALSLDRDQMRNYREKDNYTLYFPYNSDQSVEMTLDRMIAENDSEDVVLIFSSDTIPDNFEFLRRQTVEIVQNSYSGYRIPADAVRMVDGTLGVYVQKGYSVCFRRIEPLAELDGYYIVDASPSSGENEYEPLALYDSVIVKGKRLYNGKVID